ncbi:MAG: polyol transport system permease protein, partial [Micromonosporaceae bacterium]
MTTTLTQSVPKDVRPRAGDGLAAKARWIRRAPLLPALVFTIIVTQVPFIATLVISSLNWNILRPGDRSFAGLTNYKYVFTDARLRAAVVNTVVLTVSVVLISLVVGLVLAMLLDRRFPGRGLARTLLIAPFLVMPVASALLWKHALYNPTYGLFDGVLNAIWRLFGAQQGPTVDWLSVSPMGAVVAALVWQWTPFMMLILLAGLQGIPEDVREAARIDGAGVVREFRAITLPLLGPYFELAILLGMIYVLQLFGEIFVATQGGPGSETTTVPYYV